jgi:hypothetical protein
MLAMLNMFPTPKDHQAVRGTFYFIIISNSTQQSNLLTAANFIFFPLVNFRYISPEQWPSNIFPPWAHGACYVLSADLSRNIASGGAVLSLNGNILPLEDISTAIWVDYLKKSGVNPNVAILHDARLVKCSQIIIIFSPQHIV